MEENKPMTAKEFKAERLKLKHSQASIARVLGVSWRTVARWESKDGHIPPFMRMTLKIVPTRRIQKPEEK